MATDVHLAPAEVRVLGALVEKEITTPEYYPLTLNALVNACNQKSNREPVSSYEEETIGHALESLQAKGLALRTTGAGMRVPKFSHRFSERLNLGRRETALLCELMLRGAQTVGELRTRAERMHRFDDLEEVQSVLDHMSELVMKLPRRPGEKEARWMHLLSGEPATHTAEEIEGAAQTAPGRGGRVQELEQEVARLREELDALKKEFADFRAQFS